MVWSALIARGWTAPIGWLPAEKAWNRPPPLLRRMLSPMMLRAELPVQRKSTL